LNKEALILIKANVLPSRQSQALAFFKEWASVATSKEFAQDKSETEEAKKLSEREQKLYGYFVEKVVENHVTTRPKELLDYMVKELTKRDENTSHDDAVTKEDKEVLKGAWMGYLNESLKISSNVQFELELMEKIDAGKMPQIAQMLKTQEVLNDAKGNSVKLSDPTGMNFIMGTLYDPANDNSTLKFFVEQVGLTSKMVNHIIDGSPNPKDLVQNVKGVFIDLNKQESSLSKIHDAIKEFAENEEEYSKDSKILGKFMAKLDKTFENADIVERSTLAQYKESLEKALKENNQEDPMLGILVVLHSKVFLTEMMKYKTESQQQVGENAGMLNMKSSILASFDEIIPEKSELKIKSKAYRINVKNALKNIDAILKEQEKSKKAG
jgi:hypothetical protein